MPKAKRGARKADASADHVAGECEDSTPPEERKEFCGRSSLATKLRRLQMENNSQRSHERNKASASEGAQEAAAVRLVRQDREGAGAEEEYSVVAMEVQGGPAEADVAHSGGRALEIAPPVHESEISAQEKRDKAAIAAEFPEPLGVVKDAAAAGGAAPQASLPAAWVLRKRQPGVRTEASQPRNTPPPGLVLPPPFGWRPQGPGNSGPGGLGA
eukprot:TRINITY_DN8688_c0_g1_i2.p2 TRINITY_DN8688_c0_g1~~TRINITY_DN8688_c0_g1_i2.p2  ORF type:complete len:214 (+),score=53.06 TRINITY_DN8688_c0_g1_i2:133-774(+)